MQKNNQSQTNPFSQNNFQNLNFQHQNLQQQQQQQFNPPQPSFNPFTQNQLSQPQTTQQQQQKPQSNNNQDFQNPFPQIKIQKNEQKNPFNSKQKEIEESKSNSHLNQQQQNQQQNLFISQYQQSQIHIKNNQKKNQFTCQCLDCAQLTAIVNEQQVPGLFNKPYFCKNCKKSGYIMICECGHISKSRQKFKEHILLTCQSNLCKKQYHLAVCPYKKCVIIIPPNFQEILNCINCNKIFTSTNCIQCKEKITISNKQKIVQKEILCENCSYSPQKYQCFNCGKEKISTESLKRCNCGEIMYPHYWQPMKEEENCYLVDLDVFSKEGMVIQEKFMQNLHDKQNQCRYEITSICRVQNKIQWENYQFEKQRMQKTHKQQFLTPNINEKELWHGTLFTDPRLICINSKEAFDSTFSRETNLWGQAIYFAEKSEYSASRYGFQQRDSQGRETFIIMLCNVACGYSKNMHADIKILRPPYFDGKEKLEGQYDSVQGGQQRGSFYMLYGSDTRRAYPTYLVAFMKQNLNKKN